MRFVRDERGQMLIMTALSLTALLGFAALATDVGVLFHAQRELQIAADSAATTAAMDIQYGETDSSAATDAKNVVISNGWTGATLVTSSNPPSSTTSLSAPQVTINTPPLSGYHKSGTYAEAYVTEANPTFFMKLFGFTPMNVTARAVAGSPGAGDTCLYLTDPTDYDLQLQGQATINATNCGIYDNSNNSESIVTTGNGNSVNTPYLDTVGGDGNGSDAPGGNNLVNTYVAPESNPFPSAADATPSSCNQSFSTMPASKTTPIDAGGGVYCYTGNNLSIDGYTLENGTFVFTKGVTTGTTSIGVPANGNTPADPATLVVAGGTFSQGNGVLTMEAPTSGTYNAVSLLVPATNTTYTNSTCSKKTTGNGNTNGMLQIQFGSSNSNIDGYIIAPNAEVYLQDNGGTVTTTGMVSACMFEKAGTLDITSYNNAHPNTTPIRIFALVE
jgi:hypothetical protein